MMQTPNSRAGRLTEQIMQAFWRDQEASILRDLDTPTYNRIYSHVLRILEADDAEQRQGKKRVQIGNPKKSSE